MAEPRRDGMPPSAVSKIPTKLKEPTGQVAVDLIQLCAHALILLPEFLQRSVEAMESVADTAELIGLYMTRKGIEEGLFTKEETEPRQEEPDADGTDAAPERLPADLH